MFSNSLRALFLASSLLAAPAWAQQTTLHAGGVGSPPAWNPLDAGPNIALSNANLTATDNSPILGIALDFTHTKVWFFNPIFNRWNGAAIGSQNPATNTGGFTFSATGTALFPTFSGFDGSSNDAGIGNFGATSFSNSIPSGFSSWNSLAGATTWNPSDKDASITLTNSNFTATQSGAASSWRSARGTTSISSGLAYYEFTPTIVDTQQGISFGFGKSTMALNNFAGSTSSTGFSYQASGTAMGLTGSPDAYSQIWRFMRGAKSHTSSGKYYFEVTTTTINTTHFMIGICLDTPSAVTTIDFCGGSLGTGLSAQSGNGSNGFVWNNNTHVITYGAWTSGQTEGVAIDISTAKVWFWNSGTGLWNNDVIGNQNPATGTGGFTNLGTGHVYFPALSDFGFYGENTTTANFGGSSFVNTIPSGFSSWNSP